MPIRMKVFKNTVMVKKGVSAVEIFPGISSETHITALVSAPPKALQA